MNRPSIFDLDCRQCQRLSTFLDTVKAQYPDYHARPVAPFGEKKAQLMIVGLAPGMHGANATGRPFTGDYAGKLLYETLFQFGFSNQAEATALNDGLKLKRCRITNAVKCLPPENKPIGDEIRNCNRYLQAEIQQVKPRVILVLGKIAHDAVMRGMGFKLSAHKFAHHALHDVAENLTVIDSYHCSRYNTQTRRLTETMFHEVFETINTILGQESI